MSIEDDIVAEVGSDGSAIVTGYVVVAQTLTGTGRLRHHLIESPQQDPDATGYLLGCAETRVHTRRDSS